MQPGAGRRKRFRAAGLTAPAVLITSDLTERGKPYPDPYLAGAAALGADPADCVVIEDAPGRDRGRPRRGHDRVGGDDARTRPTELSDADRVLAASKRASAVELVDRAVEVALLREVDGQQRSGAGRGSARTRGARPTSTGRALTFAASEGRGVGSVLIQWLIRNSGVVRPAVGERTSPASWPACSCTERLNVNGVSWSAPS